MDLGIRAMLEFENLSAISRKLGFKAFKRGFRQTPISKLFARYFHDTA